MKKSNNDDTYLKILKNICVNINDTIFHYSVSQISYFTHIPEDKLAFFTTKDKSNISLTETEIFSLVKLFNITKNDFIKYLDNMSKDNLENTSLKKKNPNLTKEQEEELKKL